MAYHCTGGNTTNCKLVAAMQFTCLTDLSQLKVSIPADLQFQHSTGTSKEALGKAGQMLDGKL